MLRHNGAGEMLVFSAADFEDFREPRPELPPRMEGELKRVVRLLAREPLAVPHPRHLRREASRRILDVYEKVEPRGAVRRPALDHRPRRDHLRPQHRARARARRRHRHPAPHGLPGRVLRRSATARGARERTPPVGGCWRRACRVGAGTDATRVASYNPWVALYWLVTGRTVGGLRMYGDDNRLEREEALRLWTRRQCVVLQRSRTARVAWRRASSRDFAVLSADFFTVPDEAHPGHHQRADGGRRAGSCTAAEEFGPLAPTLPPAMPDWSPVRHYGGYQGRPAGGSGAGREGALARFAQACGCGGGCGVHGHAHAPGAAGAGRRGRGGLLGRARLQLLGGVAGCPGAPPWRPVAGGRPAPMRLLPPDEGPRETGARSGWSGRLRRRGAQAAAGRRRGGDRRRRRARGAPQSALERNPTRQGGVFLSPAADG